MKKSKEPLQKHTLNLYAGDFQRLNDLYPDVGGASVVLRHIIRRHIDRIEAPLVEVPEIAEKIEL